MSYYSVGADYRFTNKEGIAQFGHDEMTRKIGEGHLRFPSLIYSLRLHGGTTGVGKYYNDGEIPDATEPVYRQDAMGAWNIYIRDCGSDPSKWYRSLCLLLKFTEFAKKREYHLDGFGIKEVETILVSYSVHERTLFLEKYGEVSVSAKFSYVIKKRFPNLPQDKWANLKFKDITPLLP